MASLLIAPLVATLLATCQAQILSFEGPAGPSCVTPGGLLGNCVPAGSCRIGDATSAGCASPTVCCLRVTGTTQRRRNTLQPPAFSTGRRLSVEPAQSHPRRPSVTVRPTPTQRRLCTYIRPVSRPLSLLSRSGRGRRSPQIRPGRPRLGFSPRRARSGPGRRLNGPLSAFGGIQRIQQALVKGLKSNVRPTTNTQFRPYANGASVQGVQAQGAGLLGVHRPPPPPPDTTGQPQFFINGGGVTGPKAQGTGLVGGNKPRPRPPTLNQVLSKVRFNPPGSPSRPVLSPARPVTSQSRPVTFISRPQAPEPQYETYLDFCL